MRERQPNPDWNHLQNRDELGRALAGHIRGIFQRENPDHPDRTPCPGCVMILMHNAMMDLFQDHADLFPLLAATEAGAWVQVMEQAARGASPASLITDSGD